MNRKVKTGIKLSIILFVFLLIGTGIFKYVQYQRYITDSPFNVILSDISQDSVTITWQTEKDSNTFVKLGEDSKQLGSAQSSSIHSVSLTDLSSSKEYSFSISDGKRDWILPKRENRTEYALNEFKFSTQQESDSITLPNALEIELEPNGSAYAMLKYENEQSTLVTVTSNRFGMGLVDRNKFLGEDLQPFHALDKVEIEIINPYKGIDTVLSNNIGNILLKKVYASEINCNQKVVNQTSNAIPVAAFKDLADRWVANRGKNYATECYNDVIYRAKVAGYDPAFVLTIWLNESGASNYTQSPTNSGIIEDFGIHGNPNVPVENFNAQISYFLSLPFQYNCEGLSYWEAWGNMYRWGSCNTNDSVKRQVGIDYYKAIETAYGLVTNGKGLPSKINGYPKENPIDDGGDNNEWGETNGGICCALKLSNSSDLKGDYENNSEGKSCSDIWKVGRQLNGGAIEYSVKIDGKEGNACEVNYPGVCCNANGKTLWYPKEICNSPIDGVDEKSCNAMNKIDSYKINLKEGVNFVGLDFNPVKDTRSLLASEIFDKDTNITLVADFGSYEWKNIVKRGATVPFAGVDFELDQNKGYLIISNKDISITMDGWKDSNVTLSTLNTGWNLVGGSLYTSKATSSNLIDTLNNSEINVATIAIWNNDTAHFDYRNQTEDQIYGEDIRLSENQGIFIKSN